MILNLRCKIELIFLKTLLTGVYKDNKTQQVVAKRMAIFINLILNYYIVKRTCGPTRISVKYIIN